jgi:hypothetical protein
MLDEAMEIDGVSAELRDRILAYKRWFNTYLPAPPDETDIDPRAIFWFRSRVDLAAPRRVSPWKRRPLTKLAARVPKVNVPSDGPVDASAAAEAIRKMQELKAVIEETRLNIRVMETLRPGYVVYEDAYQIAAIPFRDEIARVQDDLQD